MGNLIMCGSSIEYVAGDVVLVARVCGFISRCLISTAIVGLGGTPIPSGAIIKSLPPASEFETDLVYLGTNREAFTTIPPLSRLPSDEMMVRRYDGGRIVSAVFPMSFWDIIATRKIRDTSLIALLQGAKTVWQFTQRDAREIEKALDVKTVEDCLADASEDDDAIIAILAPDSKRLDLVEMRAQHEEHVRRG